MEKIKNKKIKKISIIILAIIAIIILTIACSILNFIYSNKEYSKNEKNINIPIFVYHNIVDKITGPDYMQTTKENFVNQITGLKNLGYEIIRYDDLIKYDRGEKKLKEKSLIITFDDGGKSNYENLFPIIKQYNIPVTINVIDDKVGNDGYLTWEEIKEMSDSGLVDVYSHSRYHKDPNTVDTNQYVEDIEYSHKHIENVLGKNVTKIFTYPYGLYDDEKIIALEKAGFIQNLTDNKVNESDKLDLSRLHREYPLNDSVFKILLKTFYRVVRYD